MPRVELLKKNYIEPKISELLGGLLFSAKVTQKDIAKELGITQPAVNRKLHTGNLSAKDLIIILRMTDADEEIWERIKSIY